MRDFSTRVGILCTALALAAGFVPPAEAKDKAVPKASATEQSDLNHIRAKGDRYNIRHWDMDVVRLQVEMRGEPTVKESRAFVDALARQIGKKGFHVFAVTESEKLWVKESDEELPYNHGNFSGLSDKDIQQRWQDIRRRMFDSQGAQNPKPPNIAAILSGFENKPSHVATISLQVGKRDVEELMTSLEQTYLGFIKPVAPKAAPTNPTLKKD